jgi:hypothetical protein
VSATEGVAPALTPPSVLPKPAGFMCPVGRPRALDSARRPRPKRAAGNVRGRRYNGYGADHGYRLKAGTLLETRE